MISPVTSFFGQRITNNAQTSEMAVDVALDYCHDAIDLLPTAGMVNVPREALARLLDHHAQLAATADTLRRALAQRELEDARTPDCLPCTRIRRGM